ncbi:type I-E CRISPR-associated protein Cse1/CasA [Streptacidiphilus neutrinimicus]|uniref:type I-E CRISPR-associated protein Cse1/CasA n=1 Tax=Streptacidiphilus neutrinimicus TaxID=105420 RepID=UPI001EEE897C|nr:type I-E CRISPR-associated protein Cse1/CasA [Streptacidiphilus neutrinimicus]
MVQQLMGDGVGVFDLRDEAWVPVRFTDGTRARVGLRELFVRAHEISDLEVPVAPAAAGLLRVCAAIASRIGRPGGVPLADEDLADDARGWEQERGAHLSLGRFDQAMVDAYFDDPRWADRFGLFDSRRPFLQDPRLGAQCVDAKGQPNPSGVNKLVFGRPTGVNGAVLFGHFTDGDPVPVDAGEAAWHLIAQLYFGPSGQCTPRRITDHRTGSTDAGPLRKSVSYFPWAPDLFTTLVLCVPAPTGEGDPSADACPWEEDLPDPLGAPVPLSGPGRLLTGRARHSVLLVPDAEGRQVVDAYLTWATHAPPLEVRDPFTVRYRRKDGGWDDREADGSRALWRDLDALLLKDSAVDSLRPPALDRLPAGLLSVLRVRAYGFHQDGQQKDTVWFQATTPPVLEWQEEESPQRAGQVLRCHRAAEDIGARLELAALVAWKTATDLQAAEAERVKIDRRKPGPWAAAAVRAYWPAAERRFWETLDADDTTTAGEALFVAEALAALDRAIGPGARADLRVSRARNRARNMLQALAPVRATI